MCAVNFTGQESLLYFESFEVAHIDVHSAKCFPHVMSTVPAVPVVVTVNTRGGNHADMIDVHNSPQLLLHGKHGLSVVLCTVESLFSGLRACV